MYIRTVSSVIPCGPSMMDYPETLKKIPETGPGGSKIKNLQNHSEIFFGFTSYKKKIEQKLFLHSVLEWI